MIRIENVSFRYANRKEDTLCNINMHIKKGEFVVLIGDSGGGKTTINRLINNLVPVFFEGKLEGQVYVDGYDTSDLEIQDLAGIVGSVFQDPRSQFFATDTTAEIAFSCENVGVPKEELCERIEKVANDLQIKRLLERSIFELSSGEKQSIAIASVYALAPKILVLDEPSANLDIAATQHLMKVLNILKKKGYTIVVSEHRIHYLRNIADRAILIKKGSVFRSMDNDEFRQLTNEQANTLGLRSMDLLALNPKIHKVLGGEKSLIQLKNVSFAYNKNSMPLKDVSFEGKENSIIGLIGNNGGGKSTLLDVICGLKKTTSGSIEMNGREVAAMKRIRNTYLVMQDSDYQLFTESVEKELYLGTATTEEMIRKGQKLLELMGLSDYTQYHPSCLSGGQKQRLCIAVACIKNTDVICFDEPTSGLDYHNMKVISVLLSNLAHEGKTLLVISHDYEFLISTCTHICHLKDGNVSDFFEVSKDTAGKIYNFLYLKEEA